MLWYNVGASEEKEIVMTKDYERLLKAIREIRDLEYAHRSGEAALKWCDIEEMVRKLTMK